MKTVFNTILLVCIFTTICCKKKKIPVILNKPPEPLISGKCVQDVLQYSGNGWWIGQTICEYNGWRWRCPTSNPESARVCNRAESITPEKVL